MCHWSTCQPAKHYLLPVALSARGSFTCALFTQLTESVLSDMRDRVRGNQMSQRVVGGVRIIV